MLTSLQKFRAVCALTALRSGRSVLPQLEYYYNNLVCFGLSYKGLDK